MKKFIVAVCCMLTTTIAMGADPERYREPKISDFADQYLHSGSNTYTDSITSLYPKLSSQIGKHTIVDGKLMQNGTYGDEGAIIIWAARDIYEHGVRICPVQIQAAHTALRQYTWLDYHWQDNWKCRTFCHKGYSGDKCQDTAINCPVDDYGVKTGVYTLPELIDTKVINNPGDRFQHTKEMRVLSYSNEKKRDGGDDNGTRQANHVVLGVTENLDYGVRVSPIKIIGERDKVVSLTSIMSSWIVSAYSNGDSVLLCRDGYVKNATGDDCVLSQECKEQQQNNSTEWCPDNQGGSYKDIPYDAEQHKMLLLWVTNQGNFCKYYRCAADNYGFKSDKDHTCVPCETGKKSGIFVGVCTECKVGQIFNDENGCVDATKSYDQEQMKECWLKTNAAEFADCVKGK